MTVTTQAPDGFRDLPRTALRESPLNPRRTYDPAGLKDLAESQSEAGEAQGAEGDQMIPGSKAPLGEPDHLFEADTWEYTYAASDFTDTLLDNGPPADKVVRVGVLKRLPDQFAAYVPVDEPDEDGEHDDFEWRYFATEAEAQAALEGK